MKRYSLAVVGLMAALTAAAQNQVPRAVAPTPAPSAADAPGVRQSPGSVTGVPRYRAGRRGNPAKPAPATPGELSRVGEDGAINANDAKLPVALFHNNALGIAAGTPITVRLKEMVDSGHVKNGQILHGTLVNAVPGADAGSPVELSVVSCAAAGTMNSAGELSIQIVRINGSQALSQVITAEGKEGKKLTPDAAPSRGTEAQLSPDTPLELPAA